MHRTSGCASSSHSSTRASRALSELTFHVAMRTAQDFRRLLSKLCTHLDDQLRRSRRPRPRQRLVAAFVLRPGERRTGARRSAHGLHSRLLQIGSAPMHATVWSDYICPWAYLGRDRTNLLRALGVTVMPQPYELHPELPPEGRTL